MIVRVWRGVVPKTKGAKYLEYLKTTGMKDYSHTPGNIGASILMRDDGDNTEFVIISRWKSMEAIKEFAGEDPSKARYYPEDRKFLLELEPKVKHYELAFESGRSEGETWRLPSSVS